MFFTEPKSELQIRMHIAELLKDKIEQDNYSELCEKMFVWVTNGIVLPQKEKDPLNDLLTETMKKLSESISDSGDLPKPIEKKNPIIELYEKNKGREIQDLLLPPVVVCGYSIDFDCLIGGTDIPTLDKTSVDDSDFVDKKYERYRYISKTHSGLLT